MNSVSARPAARLRLDRIAGVLIGIGVLNLVVAVAKLWYGQRSGAISIQADGLNSLLDAASNVIGIIGVAAARRPADANHPYGHRKYETVAALSVAAMLFHGCYEIVVATVDRLRHPSIPDITPAGFEILLATMAINAAVFWLERREGRRLKSELLIADAAHTGSDIGVSALVMISFVAVRSGIAIADVIATGLIVGIILRAGITILKGTLSTLSDERRIDPRLIESEATDEPGVREAHNVRTRGASDDIHLDLHVLVDPEMPLAEAHQVGHRVEERLRARWPDLTDVVVHVEPWLESERARGREGGGLRAEG